MQNRTIHRWVLRLVLLGVLGLAVGLVGNNAYAGSVSPGKGADGTNAVVNHEKDVNSSEKMEMVEVLQVIKDEGFEGDFLNEGWYTNGHWGKSNCNVKTGNYSAWVEGTGGIGCQNDYHLNEESFLIYGPFNLADAHQANLDYSVWHNPEYGYDFFGVAASLDGEHWFGELFSGESRVNRLEPRGLQQNLHQPRTGVVKPERMVSAGAAPNAPSATWSDRNFSLNDVYQLGNLAGASQVWIAFYWYSDEMIAYPGGTFVDDVRISKTITLEKPSKPKLTKPDHESVVDTRRVVLNWDAAARADMYEVILKEESKDGDTVQNPTGLVNSKFKTKKLDNGGTYFWRVEACNAAGCTKSKWRSFTEEE